MSLIPFQAEELPEYLYRLRHYKCGGSNANDIRAEFYELRSMIMEAPNTRDIDKPADDRYARTLVALDKMMANHDSVVMVVDESRIRELPDGQLEIVSKPLRERPLTSRLYICSGSSYADQPSALSRGTGFFIADGVVATAGHVLLTGRPGDALHRVRFVTGVAKAYDDHLSTGITITHEQVFRPKAGFELTGACYQVSSMGADWALVQVEPVYPDRVSRLPTPLTIQEAPVTNNQKVYCLGHGLGLPVKVSYKGLICANDTNRPYFETSLTLLGGNSGSPVFNAATHELVGIYVRGINQLVRNADGCLVVHNEIVAFEGQECQRMAPLLNALRLLNRNNR